METISHAESPNVIDVKEVAVPDFLRIDIAFVQLKRSSCFD